MDREMVLQNIVKNYGNVLLYILRYGKSFWD